MMEEQDLYYRFQPTLSYAEEYNTVRDLQREPAKFLWFQLLTVMIENMTEDQTALEDMLSYARKQYADNGTMLQIIKQFGSELSDPQMHFDALKWYTSITFVSKMVNNALKSEDYVVLHKLRAFIKRLIDAIKDETAITREFWEETHTLYSGRSLTEGDIDVLKSQEGEIIAINGFLSTSFSMQVANAYHRDMFFRIRIPSNLKNIYVASIRHRSSIRNDDEVLFSLSSTFRVGKTNYGHLFDDVVGWIVDLIPTDDGSDIFNTYLLWTQNHYHASYEIIFGHLLIQMGEYTLALAYFDEYCQNEDRVGLLTNKGCAHLRREGENDFEIAEKYFLDVLTIVANKSELTYYRVSTLTNLGALYDRLEKYDKALETYNAALTELKEAEEFSQNDPLMFATINNNIGAVYDQGLENYTEAAKYYEFALEYYRQHPTHHAYAQTLQNLACALDTCGQHERARHLYYSAKEIYDRTLLPTHADMRRLLINIAITYYCEGQFNESIDINVQAKDPSGLDSLVEASRLCNMGDTYREKGLYLLAMIYSQRGLNMREKILGKKFKHVDIATALCSIGQIHLAQGDLTKAGYMFDEAEAILKCALHPNRVENSPTLALVYTCSAQQLLQLRQTDNALLRAQQARTIFEKENMTTVIDYVTCLLTIVKARHQRMEYSEAQIIASQALTIFKDHFCVHPARITALYCLASAAEAQNDLLAARQYMEDALQHLQNIKSDEIRLFYKCTNKYAVICCRQRDYANAYKYLTLWSKEVDNNPN